MVAAHWPGWVHDLPREQCQVIYWLREIINFIWLVSDIWDCGLVIKPNFYFNLDIKAQWGFSDVLQTGSAKTASAVHL